MEKKTRLIMLLCMLAVSACGLSDIGKYSDESGGAQRRLRNFRMVETEGPEVIWTLNSAEAEIIEAKDGQIIRASDINLVFHEKDEEFTELDADFGEFDRKSQVILAGGAVSIRSGDRQIDTSDVSWNPTEEIFETEREVIITGPGGVVRGTGMIASKDLSDVRLKRRISGEFSE